MRKIYILPILFIVLAVQSVDAEIISGMKYDDTNRNGMSELGEFRTTFWPIEVYDQNWNFVKPFDTGPTGTYEVELLSGRYFVKEVQENINGHPWYRISSETSYTVESCIECHEEEHACHCIQLDISPKTTKQRGGKEISYDARGKVNNSDKSSVDVELDIDWVIKMTCALLPGNCKATLSPTVSSSWSIDGISSNANGEGITSSPIYCNGICDNSVHVTQNPPQDVKSTYKATIQKGDGTNVNQWIQGTIIVTMKATDCPGSWTAKLVYVGVSGHKPRIDWPTSDYDNDGKLNKNDKYPLDPTK